VAFYTGAKALSRWPINDESTLTILSVVNQVYQIPQSLLLLRTIRPGKVHAMAAVAPPILDFSSSRNAGG
jgi:hypothetical protein